MVLFSLTVVRHGETDYNSKCLIQGQQDCTLNENGRQQARLLGQSLSLSSNCQLWPPFTHVFSSDLSRTIDTATLVLEGQLGSVYTKIQKDARLRERHFGVLENEPQKLLRVKAKEAGYKTVLEYVPEGAESLYQLHVRVVEFFKYLCQSIDLQTRVGSPMETRSRHSSSRRKLSKTGLPQLIEEEEADDRPVFSPQTSMDHEKNEESRVKSNSGSLDSGLPPDEPLTIEIGDEAIRPLLRRVQSDSSSDLPLSSPMSLSPDANLCSPDDIPAPGPLGRKFSVQSVASDDSYYPELDAHVLVVAHGGAIRELLRYFLEDLGCLFPCGRDVVLRGAPNTGLCKFMVSMEFDGGPIAVTCQELHNKDHLIVEK